VDRDDKDGVFDSRMQLMTDPFTDRVFDSISNETPSVSRCSSDGESSLSAHSWQAWSVSRENFLAGRTDLKARDVHLVTFPNFPPTIGELKARARTGEAQYVMLEHYAGVIGDKKKRINEDTRLIEFPRNANHDQTDLSTESGTGMLSANSPAQTLNATAESIRAARELLRELAPPPPSALSRDEISGMINRALSDSTAQLQATKPEEKSEISRLRELMEFQRELQAQFISQRSEPEISDRDRTLLTLMRETGAAQEFFRSMRELIATPEQVAEHVNWKDRMLEVASQNPQIVERVSSTLERIVARVLPNPRIAPPAKTVSSAPVSERRNPAPAQSSRESTLSAPPSQTNQSPAPPAQAVEQEETGVTLDSFVLGIKEDIQEGNDPDEAIADAATIVTEQPELWPVVVALLQKPNEELLALLHQATGAQLDSLSNAQEYLDGLRDGVRKRVRIPQNDAS
jgi:hypothetical protein